MPPASRPAESAAAHWLFSVHRTMDRIQSPQLSYDQAYSRPGCTQRQGDESIRQQRVAGCATRPPHPSSPMESKFAPQTIRSGLDYVRRTEESDRPLSGSLLASNDPLERARSSRLLPTVTV